MFSVTFFVNFTFPVPKIMLTALEVTNKELQQSLIVIMDYINTFTTAIDKCFSCDSKSDGYYLACELPEGVEEEDLEYIKDMLVFHRQYEIYVRYVIISKNLVR